MEDFFINTLMNKSCNNSNIECNDGRNNTNIKALFIRTVVLSIITSIGLPLTLLAIYGLYSQVRKDHVAPIYIINLLISDIIQFCSFIVEVAKPENLILRKIAGFMHVFGVTTSICFMVCIALERYLVIAWPLWYRFRRTIKTSVVVCVVVWVFSLVFLVSLRFWIEYKVSLVICGVLLLLPLPLLIFFLFGTIKALSAAISVPPDEKRRIVAILVLVLLIYTLLFLTNIVRFFAEKARTHDAFKIFSRSFVRFSPLADLFLYVFSRKGAADKFLSFVCRCRMNSDSDISRTTA